jgi:DnaJ-class molecular chaperone
VADPYQVLGLEPGSDDARIRRRYLDLVRQHPPEREPQRFATIREAYDQLRDPARRLRSRLFPDRSIETIDAILAEVERRVRGARIPVKTLLSLAER